MKIWKYESMKYQTGKHGCINVMYKRTNMDMHEDVNMKMNKNEHEYEREDETGHDYDMNLCRNISAKINMRMDINTTGNMDINTNMNLSRKINMSIIRRRTMNLNRNRNMRRQNPELNTPGKANTSQKEGTMKSMKAPKVEKTAWET